MTNSSREVEGEFLPREEYNILRFECSKYGILFVETVEAVFLRNEHKATEAAFGCHPHAVRLAGGRAGNRHKIQPVQYVDLNTR